MLIGQETHMGGKVRNSAVSRFHKNMFSCSDLVMCIQMDKLLVIIVGDLHRHDNT